MVCSNCLLLSEYSAASVLLHDRYRLEEEKIDNFYIDFFFFQLTLQLKRRTTTLHFQLLLFSH